MNHKGIPQAFFLLLILTLIIRCKPSSPEEAALDPDTRK